MLSKAVLFATTLLFSTTIVKSQDFQKQFLDWRQKEDTSGQLKVLKQWQAAKPTDPELFIAYFNYYVQQSRTENISLDKDRNGKEGLVITDTGTGAPVGYLNASTQYHTPTLQRGFDFIEKGIQLHPTRLDMRFGKIHMLGEAQNFEAFTAAIIETVHYGEKIKHKWHWKEGKPLDDPAAFFLDAVQEYISTLFNTEEDSLLPHMRRISEVVLQYHPQHVESLSNIAITYLIPGAYDEAMPYLLKAEAAAPKDIVVLNNIAETYKRKKDTQQAKTYYEKIIRYGNSEEAKAAKQRIKAL